MEVVLSLWGGRSEREGSNNGAESRPTRGWALGLEPARPAAGTSLG